MRSPLTCIIRWIQFPYLWLRYGSPIKSDETVVLFPQSASVINSIDRSNESGDGAIHRSWSIPIHAWVVEKETGTLSRLIAKYYLLSFLGLTGVASRQSATEVFDNRLSWFMVDREVNKKVSVLIGGEKYVSPRTSPSGHVKFSVPYSGAAPEGSILKCQVADLPSGHQPIEGRVQLVGEHGISVISDFDDTIKISNVTDKKALVRGLFFDNYHPVAGMPDFYYELAVAGASFHYVSASPWQLYPSIAPFLDKFYPFGCLTQRRFYIGDKSFINFFRSSRQYKIESVARLIERYPKRRFILIGDSGENDPEVYLHIANRYKEQVCDILIREVYNGSVLAEAGHDHRWRRISDQLDEHQRFEVFHDPAELGPVSRWLANSHSAGSVV